MKATPRIGGWWSYCCLLDCYPIRTAADLRHVEEMVADDADEPLGLMVFASFADAVRHLDEGDPEALAAVYARTVPDDLPSPR